MPSDFRPTATIEALRWRADVVRSIRQFFHDQGYWEAEVPLLSQDGPVDPHLDAFTIQSGRQTFALQTSPEFGLKRLVASGADAVFQLGKAFRRGERGARHNPEFTMLEWYRVGDSYLEQMDLVEALVRECGRLARPGISVTPDSQPFPRLPYRQAFQTYARVDPATATTADLKTAAIDNDVTLPNLSLDDRDGWLNLLLVETVEPRLGFEAPVFLCDYPASQSALAHVRPEAWPVSERFELYVRGIEVCNGYTELTNPGEMLARMARESARRLAEGQAELAASNRLVAALEDGLPPCAGVALGVDRLLMLLWGTTVIDDVIAFPWERA